ncbi:hypothetical protein AALD74_20840 [Lachnospiraceae bacterium 48-21]|jgi:hypothetical protein
MKIGFDEVMRLQCKFLFVGQRRSSMKDLKELGKLMKEHPNFAFYIVMQIEG